MRSSQLSFNDPRFKKASPHGGEHSKRVKFRTARPLSTTKHSMHVVVKSSLAKGKYSFRGKNLGQVDRIVAQTSRRYGVKLHRYGNAGNHLHLLISSRNRFALQRWFKILPQRVMFAVTGLNKETSLQELVGRKHFFDYRPFSRIVEGRRGFQYAANYVEKNILETEGLKGTPTWKLAVDPPI